MSRWKIRYCRFVFGFIMTNEHSSNTAKVPETSSIPWKFCSVGEALIIPPTAATRSFFPRGWPLTLSLTKSSVRVAANSSTLCRVMVSA